MDDQINRLYESIRMRINEEIDSSVVRKIRVSSNMRQVIMDALNDDEHFKMTPLDINGNYNGVRLLFSSLLEDNMIRIVYKDGEVTAYDLSDEYDRVFGIQFSAELFDKII